MGTGGILMARPTAAPAHFPYRHRNMAQVMRDEQSERIAESHRRMLRIPTQTHTERNRHGRCY